MPTGRIATVTPVSEESATGKVAAIFADIKATKNITFVPNLVAGAGDQPGPPRIGVDAV